MRAFTLIELLISVAIIALLLSILLPAAAAAKRAARSTTCQGSLRSFGQAIKAYEGDFNTIPETTQKFINLSLSERDMVKFLALYWDAPEPSMEERVIPWCCPADNRTAFLQATGGTYFYYAATIYQVYCLPPSNKKLRALYEGQHTFPVMYDGVKFHGNYWNVLYVDGSVRANEGPVFFTPY